MQCVGSGVFSSKTMLVWGKFDVMSKKPISWTCSMMKAIIESTVGIYYIPINSVPRSLEGSINIIASR